MTQTNRGCANSSKLTVDWGSRGSGIVIERSAHGETDWQVVSFRPQEKPVEGSSIDDVIADLAKDGIDLATARREMGDLLADTDVASLRALRLQAGLSQRELGERIGMSQSNIARLERRPGDIGLGTLRRLAQALGVDLNTLDRAIP